MTDGAQVLVVEDEGLVALSLQRKLENLGYRVPAVVATGEEAVDVAGNLSPDLVLMDIMLEGPMDGVDAASRIRDQVDVPIVFLTAYSDDTTVERAKSVEPFGYLVKPIDERELRTTIEMALNKHRIEKEVRASERRLSTTLMSIGDAVIVTDVNGSVTFANPAAEAMTGWPAGEALGRHITEVFDVAREDPRGSAESPVEKTLREGIILGLPSDAVLRSRDGVRRPVDDSVAPIRDEQGTTLGAVLVFRDVSDRRRTEAEMRRQQEHLDSLVMELSRALGEARGRAEVAQRAKSEFLGSMSHELRTPLIGVLGMAELLLGTDLTDRQRHYVDVVLNSGRSLLEIINEILVFSKIEGGKLELEAAEFAPHALIDEAVAPLKEQVAAKGLTLSLGIAPDVPPLVIGDPARLRQVLAHLVGNAIKFTDSGRVEVRAATADRSEDGGRISLRFEVTDTGIGIAPGEQTRIFEPFVQVDASMTRRHGGTGLGLAIARRLCQSMGGKLNVCSEEGRGSCFFFTAPFRVPASASCREEATVSPRVSEEESGFDAEVLVVEDNVVNQEVARVMLEWLGCSVTAVNNGREALAATAERRYDVVLMDCFMPEVDGFTATAALRRREEEAGGRRVPIIAVTADVQEGFEEECLAAGMDAYLSKPFDRKQLASVLARFIPRGRTEKGNG